MSNERLSTNRNRIPLSTEYAALPKRFGLTYPNALLSVGERAEQKLSEIPDEQHNTLLRALHHEIAADSYLEASLTTADPTHEHDDQRLLLVDSAMYHYQQSTTIRETRTIAGLDDPDDVTEILRLQIRTGLESAYKDVVCGEVTTQTGSEVGELFEEKKRFVTKASHAIKKGIDRGYYPSSHNKYLSAYAGLLAEIQYLESIWQNEEDSDTTVAFLSTVRGGSGNTGIHYKGSRDTHDVVVATSVGDNWVFKPVEVKRVTFNHASISQHTSNYTSEIAFVSKRGEINSVPEIHPARRVAS